METARFAMPPPRVPPGKRDPARTLRGVLILIPYVIIVLILAMAIAISGELDAPRGTLAWLSRSGMDLRVFGTITALCAGVGAWFWRSARRHWLSGIGLMFVVSLPYAAYCGFATRYLTTEANSSDVALIMYWGGYVFCFLLVAVVSLLLAWLELMSTQGDD